MAYKAYEGGSFGRGEVPGDPHLRLQEAERRYQLLLSHLPGMAYRCLNSPEWPVEFASEGALALTGYRPDQFVGECRVSYASLIDKRDRERVWLRVQEAIRTREPFQLTYRIQAADGTIKHVWEQGQAVFDEEGNVVALEGFISDFTEREHYEQELRHALERAEEVARLKSSLFSNLSHEIRTPLTIILGFVDTLQDVDDRARRRFIGLIKRNAQNLLATLNSVLELAHLESTTPRIESTRVNLRDPIKSAAEEFAAAAGEKGILLDYELGDEPVYARADRDGLDRILKELLSNAVKFTNQGSIHVRLRKRGSEAEISVEDTGIGVGADFLADVFEPFRQESEGPGRSYSGMGLGLSLARGFAELMGGRIAVESERGSGSTFRVYLPLAP